MHITLVTNEQSGEALYIDGQKVCEDYEALSGEQILTVLQGELEFTFESQFVSEEQDDDDGYFPEALE